MNLDRNSRRNKSLFMNSAKLESLTEPINKIIKPSQVYNDYALPVRPSQEFRLSNSITKAEKSPVYYSLELTKVKCNCHCHKKQGECSESHLSTANSKRSKVLTPSPIKHSAREVLSRNSLNQSPIFPYGSPSFVNVKKVRAGQKIHLFQGKQGTDFPLY